MMEISLLSLLSEYVAPVGIAIFIFWMILTGRLIPREHFNRLNADLDKYSETNQKLMETNQILVEANLQLAEAGKTTLKMVKSMPTIEEIEEQNNENK